MCNKNSCEAGTEEVDNINTMVAKLSETVFLMFYPIHNIIMLDFFRNQHSKTECTVRSFGLIATCCMKTSSVQGVHHAGVAVELELLLKKKLVVMVIPRLLRALRLLFSFTTYIAWLSATRFFSPYRINARICTTEEWQPR